jgi:hypothetical protein
MDPPSREALEGKLQIYADGFVMERCLACEADGRNKSLIAAKRRKKHKTEKRKTQPRINSDLRGWGAYT